MQGDCNLVIYHDGKAIWSTDTHGSGEYPVQIRFIDNVKYCYELDPVRDTSKTLSMI